MIPVRFQGCRMGIFGLASWDPPPPLPPHLASGLAPRVFSEQAAVPTSSKVIPYACQTDSDVHQSNAASSIDLPGAHAAVLEKNPFWSGGASTQAWPVEETCPPLGVEKKHEARVSSSEVMGRRGIRLKNSSETEFDADAVKLKPPGRGSRFRSSSGAPPVGSVGSAARPSVVGSIYQTGESAAETAARQNPGFQSGSQLGDGDGRFSGKLVEPASSPSVGTAQKPLIPGTKEPRAQSVHTTSCLNPASPEFVPQVDPLVASQIGCRLIAKHNYEANPNSPLGAGGELNLRRMERLVKIGCHPVLNIWWLARNEDGEEGYIPSSYVMVLEEKLGMPWLLNRAPEEEEALPSTTQTAKPYRSAYSRSSTRLSTPSQFACAPCGKDFNGPQPCKAHVSSRAHQEVLETMD